MLIQILFYFEYADEQNLHSAMLKTCLHTLFSFFITDRITQFSAICAHADKALIQLHNTTRKQTVKDK